MSNISKWVAVVIAAITLGAVIGHRFALRGGDHSTGRSASPPTGGQEAGGERKVLYWHDPMVPGTRFDKPGKSPFMDMQLVPVYADQDDSSGSGGDVRVNANVTQNLGIRLSKVEKRVLPQLFNAVGNVTFDERLLQAVQARVDGYVTRLYIKAPLERVRRGQPLAEILAPEWLAAQQDYLALLDSQSISVQSIRDAARERLVVLGVPGSAIRVLERDRKTQPTTTLFSPIDGVVTELAVREGAAFAAGGSLMRINGLSTVWVNAQIPEARVSFVTTGSDIEVHATAWPETTFKGRVVALLPDVDLQTRTLTARLAIENPEYKLSPGMFVSVAFKGSASEPQLVVPSEAVIVTGERSIVIVARKDGAFDVAEVKVGSERDGLSTILSGLDEGQAIVLSGQFLIDSEASLKATVDRLTSAPSAAPEAQAQEEAAPRDLHLTQGIVNAISPTEITIAHDPVPSLQWGAMTMSFKLPAEGLPRGIDVGTHVNFSFSTAQAGGFQIDSITAAEPVRP